MNDKANKTTEESKSFVVAQRFRDAKITDKYIVYEEGEPAHFEGERLAELIAKGFVKEK